MLFSFSSVSSSILSKAYSIHLIINLLVDMSCLYAISSNLFNSSSLYNSPVKTTCNYEVGSNSSSTIYSAKIGLAYVSDYGFAASPSYWTTNLSSFDNAVNNNWMHLGSYEWTISRVSSNSNTVLFVNSGGSVGYNSVHYSFAVRPSFYLIS